MTLLPFNDVFACLAHWVETSCLDERLCLHDGGCTEAPADACLPLGALWIAMRNEDRDSAKRAQYWRTIAHHLEREAQRGLEGPWTIIALWLLTPRLKGVARTIVGLTGAERGDVCSEVLAGAVQGMRTIRAAHCERVEGYLVREAYAAGRKTSRRARNEVPEPDLDIGLVVPDPHLATSSFLDGHVVEAGPMSMALVQRVHGERLGALAQRLGLLQHVREVRRQRRVGPGRKAWPGQRLSEQQERGLFEIGEDA
ncbi:hypothetical protein ABZ682_14125 [Streptomyces griseoviridis]|uniref:hypothetical protein n=1 Tax=Streptomyces griseoviridis TaxID=45398 RepID=UPI0033E5C45D